MPDTIQERKQPPPPLPIIQPDGEEHYEVERIIDSKMDRGKIKYLVHWKGYPVSERTWEPAENVIPGARRAVNQFNEESPLALR